MLEIRARKWSADGVLVGDERHAISMRSYGAEDLRAAVERAGLVVDRADLRPDGTLVVTAYR